MTKTLIALALLALAPFAQAETAEPTPRTTITSCRWAAGESIEVVGTIAVSRDDEGLRVLDGRLSFSGVLLNDPVCNSRRCVFKPAGEPSAADTTYTLYPTYRKGSDRIVGMTMNQRSSIIDANDHLGTCRAEKQLPEDIY